MAESARTVDAHERRRFDRRLFLASAAMLPLLVLAGFARTYYLKAAFGTPPLPGLVHLHGLVMTAWVVLFVTQVSLISTKRVRLHRRLGYASIALAVLVVVTGAATALRAAKYGPVATPGDLAFPVPPLAFLAVPLFDLVVFAILFTAGVACRQRPAAHKGLMLLAAIGFLPPAIARIPVASLQGAGPLWFFGLPTALSFLALVMQARAHGRVNRVVLAGTVLLVGSFVLRLWLMNTGAWLAFAAWATSFV
jgi:hypothetical protein